MDDVKSIQQPRKKGQKEGQKKDSKQKWTSFQLWDNLKPMNPWQKDAKKASPTIVFSTSTWPPIFFAKSQGLVQPWPPVQVSSFSEKNLHAKNTL